MNGNFIDNEKWVQYNEIILQRGETELATKQMKHKERLS